MRRLERLAKAFPDHYWVDLALAAAERRDGKVAIAEARYERLLRSRPRNRAVVLGYAEALVERGGREAGERAVAVMRPLLDHGADPTLTQEGDFVPLHSAAQNQNLEMARLLLQHGADPAATSREGKSALEYSPGTPEWVALLQPAR